MSILALLALLGGKPSVTLPAPRAPGWSDAQAKALRAAIELGRGDPDWLSAISGRGPVAELEHAFERYMGGGYALAVNSGGSALELALRAVGVERGDRVAVAGYNWSQSASCITNVGAQPVWVDVEAGHPNLSASHLQEVLASDVKAVVVTHLFGLPADMASILRAAERRRVAVVEDCAQSATATYGGLRVGGFGDAAAFSFGRHKHILAGEGGMLFTRRHDVYERAVLLSQHIERQLADRHMRAADPLSAMTRASLRIHPLAAVAAREALRAVETIQRRMDHAHEWVVNELRDLACVRPPEHFPGRKHAWYALALKFTGERWGIPRSVYVAALQAEGVPILSGYLARPLWEEKIFEHTTPERRLPAVEDWCYRTGLLLLSGTSWAQASRRYLRQVAAAFHKLDQHRDDLRSYARGHTLA